MWYESFDELHRAGFIGFQSIAELRATCLGDVPWERGVYVVFRESEEPPRFLATSRGGHFKGKDPTVSTELLSGKWVAGARVVYVGKAGAEGKVATLRSRLRAYLDFGSGMPVGHWGGRYIWQLLNADALVICWKPTPDEDPRTLEKSLIAEFAKRYGKLPFANCQM